MDDHEQVPKDESREQLRVRQLLNQLDEITDGQAQFNGTSDLPADVEVSFLEHMIRYETAPRTTWLEKLKSVGYEMPDPNELSESALGLELWQVIQRLAEVRVFLYSTNHLSDRGLYENLFRELLTVDVPDLSLDEHSAYHIDILGSGSDEDVALWLTYYADENERSGWQKENPNEHLPPHMTPPFARDHLLPKREEMPRKFKQAVEELIYADWKEPDGPIQLAGTLTASEVGHLDIVVASLMLLEHLAAEGGVKATATSGNLPRRTVEALYDQLPLDAFSRESTDRFCKVKNEQDVHLLHQARITCEAARLIQKRKGVFIITKAGRAMRKPDNIGSLYRALFIAYFRINSLAYFDRRADQLTCIQDTLPVILWRLSLVARNWTDLEILSHQTLLPYAFDQVMQYEDSHSYLKKGEIMEYRVWCHLHQFGLLEAAPINEDGNIYHRYETYRISPLFDQFLHFRVDWQ